MARALTRVVRSNSPLIAYVLHHYDWSESSLILDLFTREQGRIAVVAKGAKRPYSQLRSVLLPFQRVQVLLTKGGVLSEDGVSEVFTLRQAERASGPTLAKGAALFSGYYLNELLLKLLVRHDVNTHLFDAYAQTLLGLHANDDAQSQCALRAFEITLLRELGLLPELGVLTTTQQALEPDCNYCLSGEGGVVPPGADLSELHGRTLLALHANAKPGQLLNLQQACALNLSQLPALRNALRAVLHYHLGHATLRTREVLLDTQRLLDL